MNNRQYRRAGSTPLFVRSENDPRLRAYNDSLYAYNRQAGNLTTQIDRGEGSWINDERKQEFNSLQTKRQNVFDAFFENLPRGAGLDSPEANNAAVSIGYSDYNDYINDMNEMDRRTSYISRRYYNPGGVQVTPVLKDSFSDRDSAENHRIRGIAPVDIEEINRVTEIDRPAFRFPMPVEENKYGTVHRRNLENSWISSIDRENLTPQQRREIGDDYWSRLEKDEAISPSGRDINFRRFMEWLENPSIPFNSTEIVKNSAYTPLYKKPVQPVIFRERPPEFIDRTPPQVQVSRTPEQRNTKDLIDIQSHHIDPWDTRFGEVPESEIEAMRAQHRDKIQLRRTTDRYGRVTNVWPSEYSDELRENLIPYGHQDRQGFTSGSDYMEAIRRGKIRRPLRIPTYQDGGFVGKRNWKAPKMEEGGYLRYNTPEYNEAYQQGNVYAHYPQQNNQRGYR